MANRTCRECNAAIDNLDYRAEFCGDKCRKQSGNRRMLRGAELYDIFMLIRFQRGTAKALGLWNLMCRLASAWNEEDRQHGRRSYGRPEKVMERMTVYLGTVVHRGR